MIRSKLCLKHHQNLKKPTRESYLLRKYGITNDQYEELLRKQEGRCAVCQKQASSFKSRLCVDHDHWTGNVRGLLCTYCNRRIVGRHRTPVGEVLFTNAAKYLAGPYPGWVVPKRKKKRARRVRRYKSKAS